MVAVVFLLCLLVTAVRGISVSEVVGTWSSKSSSVVTGPVGISLDGCRGRVWLTGSD